MSGQHRHRRTLLFLGGWILGATVLGAALSHWDDTPHWASVRHPAVAWRGRPCLVRVQVRRVEQPLWVEVIGLAVRQTGQQRRWDRLPSTSGPQRVLRPGTFVFDVAVPDDPHLIELSFRVTRRGGSNDAMQPSPILEPRIRTDRLSVRTPTTASIRAWRRERSWPAILARAWRDGHWRQHAGDPTTVGWAVTLGTLAVGGLCLWNWRRRTRAVVGEPGPGPRFWMTVGILMLLLGINKQLDLQLGIADLGREIARTFAWYTTRKSLQIRVIAVGVGLGGTLLVALAIRCRGASGPARLALAGLLLLLGCTGLALVSLHRLDHLLQAHAGGLSLAQILEIIGVGSVGLGAGMEHLRLRGDGTKTGPEPPGAVR